MNFNEFQPHSRLERWLRLTTTTLTQVRSITQTLCQLAPVPHCDCGIPMLKRTFFGGVDRKPRVYAIWVLDTLPGKWWPIRFWGIDPAVLGTYADRLETLANVREAGISVSRLDVFFFGIYFEDIRRAISIWEPENSPLALWALPGTCAPYNWVHSIRLQISSSTAQPS